MPKGGGIFVTAGYRRGPAFPGGDFWSVQNRWIQTDVRKISASRNIFLKRFLHVFTRFHDLIFYHFCKLILQPLFVYNTFKKKLQGGHRNAFDPFKALEFSRQEWSISSPSILLKDCHMIAQFLSSSTGAW